MTELEIIQKTLDEHKGEDISTIDVSEFSPFATHYVLATAQNPRALAALQDHVEEELVKAGYEIVIHEGEPDSGWVITQADDVVVHIFLEANRRVINLEELLDRMQEKIHKA